MRWGVIIVLGLGLLAYGVYKLNYPTYSWRQNLTLMVETPEGVRTGSAVGQVTHWFHPAIPVDAGSWNSSLRGEAVVVDLGDGRYLFALLDESPKKLKAAFADRLPEFTYGENGLKRFFRAVERLRGAAAPVPFAALPRLVTFGDISDPTSVRLVDPDDLAAVFGEGFALREVTLEITDAPVTSGVVEGVLGWLPTASYIMPPDPQDRYGDKRTPEQRLMPNNFIDWRTLHDRRVGAE